MEGAFDYFCLRLMHWPFSKQSFVFTKLFTCRFQKLTNVTMDLDVLNYTSLCSEGHLQENPHALLARWILYSTFSSLQGWQLHTFLNMNKAEKVSHQFTQYCNSIPLVTFIGFFSCYILFVILYCLLYYVIFCYWIYISKF